MDNRCGIDEWAILTKDLQKMKQTQFTILRNEPLTAEVWRMTLEGDVAAVSGIRPGQFVELQLPGLFLRRPISVCDAYDRLLIIIYKVVGKGTAAMAAMQAGMQLDVLTHLGNGYDLSLAGDHPLLVGGGVGVPPMYMLAKQLRAQGKSVHVVLGFNTQAEVFCEEDFRALGCEVSVTTVDGSYGTKGFVTNALPAYSSYYYACGPLPMLRALAKAVSHDGELSMEERMGCGFGACMGCSIQTVNGPKRVCKDGPVFKASELKL